jgi:DNA-binding transcriptional LysR family regulator
MVLGGAVELGIAGYRETHRHLEYTQAWPDELVLVVPPAHQWAGEQAVTVEQLAEEPFIQRESGSGTRAQLQNELESICGYGCERFNVVAQLGSSTAVKEAIGQGLGVSILSRHAVARELASGSLHAVSLEGAGFKRSFWLVEDRRRSLSPLAEGFKQYILQSYPGE